MEYSSQLLKRAIDEFTKLPGIGEKSALRFALHLLSLPQKETQLLTSSLDTMRENIRFCSCCHAISDTETCTICSNPKRSFALICVVESIRDVMAIEQTNQYQGVYHVLGGVISPLDGVGIQDLTIQHLIKRIEHEKIEEIILALPATMEGDTTNFYLHKVLQPYPVKVTAIARGVSVGDNLEYADEVTLGRSILHRVPFNEMYRTRK